jgi:hypothetical protein
MVVIIIDVCKNLTAIRIFKEKDKDNENDKFLSRVGEQDIEYLVIIP